MEKNLAIIGASYLQLPLIKKAKEMGYITHVFAWKADDVGEYEADYFYPISIIEKDAILETCRDIGICGICSIASDLATVTVNYVAHHLNLVGNSLNTTYNCTNKFAMREVFKKHGDPIPNYWLLDVNSAKENIGISFPAIVKPTDRSGSRGVYKVGNGDELNEAINKSICESFEKKVIVEEYVEGNEYSVEYISVSGRHFFLAMTQKYTTGAPNFVEKGHGQPAELSEQMSAKVKATVEHALDSLEIEYGASHSEIKIDSEGNIKIIEIGARMGGDCIGSHLVYYSTGVDFVKAVIQVACGEIPDLTKNNNKTSVECRYILDEKDVEAFNMLKINEPEKIIDILYFEKELVGKYTDSSNRAGCYIAKK